MTVTNRCKALGSAIRVAILDVLRETSPMTLLEIADEFLGAASLPTTLRRHLQILCDAGLCERVAIGRKFYYTIGTSAGKQLAQDIKELFIPRA